MTISNFTEIANHDDQHEGGGRAKRDLSPSSREDGMATREKPRAVNWPPARQNTLLTCAWKLGLVSK